MNRVKDHQGAAWPVTGFTCSTCRWPLDPVIRDDGAHPNCEPQPREGAFSLPERSER